MTIVRILGSKIKIGRYSERGKTALVKAKYVPSKEAEAILDGYRLLDDNFMTLFFDQNCFLQRQNVGCCKMLCM